MPTGLEDSIERVCSDAAGMVAARNVYIATVAPAQQDSCVSMQPVLPALNSSIRISSRGSQY